MQRYCTELTERLLKSLDKEYNVVDMGAVVDVITALEKTTITKEVLEVTRLGKYINELRRKTNNDALAKRAKDLVRRWRDMVLPSSHPTPQPTPADTAPQALNGTKPQSPALRGLKPHSPAAIRALKPHSPLLRDSTTLKVLSPALHSERSRSPSTASTKQQGSLSHASPTATTANATNHRLNTELTSKLGVLSTHNHTFDAVPRTHSSNKRLRKEDSSGPNSPITPPLTSSVTSSSSLNRSQLTSLTNDARLSRFEPLAKRARLNGETANYDNFQNTTDPSNNNVLSTQRAPPANSGVNVVPMQNQKVPSPGEGEKAEDRLSSETISRKSDGKREAIVGDAAITSEVQAGPKKRGRKKGSKSTKNQTLPEDRVKEKLASISRNPKLKTTQELLADLQARGSSTSASFATGGTTTSSAGTTSTGTITTTSSVASRNSGPPSTEEILRNEANDDRPLSARFQRGKRDKTHPLGEANRRNRDGKGTAVKHWENSKKSEEDDEDEDDEDTEQEEQPYVDGVGDGGTRELTVEEILAKLPPLDRDAISWSDCENVNEDDDDREVNDEKREIREEDVDRLHNERVEGLNGNYQSRIRGNAEDEASETTKRIGVCGGLAGKENDREFREWHEMLARPSYEGQILHILPYVIID